MLKYLVAVLLVIAAGVGAFYTFNSYIYDTKFTPLDAVGYLMGQGGVKDYKQVTVVIDGEPVTIGTEGTQFFGNEAKGDLNDDGIPDLAFLFTRQTSGSGTFYYAVGALQNSAGRYIGTNAVFLGDRIAPQTSKIRNGIVIVNYADRGPEDPFSTPPYVGVSAYLYYLDGRLLSVPPVGPIVIEGQFVCLPHRDTEGPQTMECAFGLLDDAGRYFALSDTDPQYANLAQPMNGRVRVEGSFKLRMGSNYTDIGVIDVTKLTAL